jgi:MFS transporter, DHA1 family, tetracycline resistance protein
MLPLLSTSWNLPNYPNRKNPHRHSTTQATTTMTTTTTTNKTKMNFRNPKNMEDNLPHSYDSSRIATSKHMTAKVDSSSSSSSSSLSSLDWSITALLLSAFLNLLGFTMAGPLTPSLGQHFQLPVGASFGSLTSAYPLGMLVGLFLWPPLSDQYGRPPIITLTLLGTAMGLATQAYFVQTNQKSLVWFLASRVLTGCFAGASPVSKAYLADRSPPHLLSKHLAWRDAASTLAFLVGPLLGGIFLTTSSLSFVIAISSVASLLAAIVVGTLCIQQQRQALKLSSSSSLLNSKRTDDDESKNSSNQDLKSSLPMHTDLVSCPLGTSLWSGVATVCLVSFLFHVGDSTFHAFFSALLKTQRVSPSQIGLVYSNLAGISLTVSALATSKIMRKCGPVATCVMGLTATGMGLLMMGFVSSSSLLVNAATTPLLLSAAALYYCGVPLYSPTIPIMLLRCVPPNRRGFILGLDGAINTIARIIAPIFMGHLYRTHGSSAAFGLAGKAALFSALLALGKRVHVLRQENINMAKTT